MRLDALPPRMAVIGGGFVACELAHVFSALGVAVTQVQRGPTLLRHHEVEVAQRYTEVARHHYDLRLSTTADVGAARRRRVADRARRARRARATSRPRSCCSPWAGVPNTDRLDPAAGGLDVHDDGRLVVDARAAHHRTGGLGARRRLVGAPAQARRQPRGADRRAQPRRRPRPARRRAARRPTTARCRTPSSATRRSRPSGRPRPSSSEAGTPFVTATQAVGDVAYGWALEDTTGLLTIHADPTGRILAAHAIGPHASTLIQPLVQAASFGQRAIDVARGQYWIHPALAEVVENALLGLPLPDPA